MSDQPVLRPDRRSLLLGAGVGASALAVSTLAPTSQAAPPGNDRSPTEADPTIEGPASLTAAMRGSIYRDGLIYAGSRSLVAPSTFRLGAFDPIEGAQVEQWDLDFGSTGGNIGIAQDEQFLYLGPAGSAWVWRFDPTTGDAEQFAEVGPATTWTYSMLVHGEYLWVGTYPEGRLLRISRASREIKDFGRVGASNYTVSIAVDEQYVYAATAAPGDLKVYHHDGTLAYDLTSLLPDSPVGVLKIVLLEERLYVSVGRFVLSMLADGSDLISHPIDEDDRYIDHFAVTPDGRVLALARTTTKYYEVTSDGLQLLGQPWQDAENVGFFALDDGTIAGVTGPGHVWSSPIGGESTVLWGADTGFGYPEKAQSILAHSDQSVWVGGNYSMTVHSPRPRNYGQGNRKQQPSDVEPIRFQVAGEPKSMVETSDGLIVAGLYPSTHIVAIDPGSTQQTLLGVIGNEQMRPLSIAYDEPRGDVLVASTATHGLHTGALTFANPSSGQFDVRRDFLPDQNLRTVAVHGDFAYIAGDTYAEAATERPLEVASIAEIDLRTRKITRSFQPREVASYERIAILDGVLYAVSRRPNGAWFALDLTDEEVIAEGDTGGYGGIGIHRGNVYVWDHFTDSIQQLTLDEGGTNTVVYDDVPTDGWFNNPEFAFVRTLRGFWGMHETDLAWYLFPR